MNCRFLVLMSALTVGIAVEALLPPTAIAQTAKATSRSSPRTPWGDPDIQGQWTNTTTTPLERPEEFKGKAVLTAEERAEHDRKVAERVTFDRVPRAGSTGTYNEFWVERGTLSNQTSLVVAPDGKLPALTPEGQKRQAERTEARKTSPADGPESRNLYERCISRGLPGAMMPGFYNHNYHIMQTPGYVVILVEMIHDARIIPLDGRPHVGTGIRQWLGDSRGRWEGNTLVVETTNFKNMNVNDTSTNVTGGEGSRVVERFTRVNANAIDYQVTVDDPVTYTKSWTAAIPMRKLEGQVFEYACHEGNYGMPGILAGTRAEEKAAKEAKK